MSKNLCFLDSPMVQEKAKRIGLDDETTHAVMF